MGEAGSSQHFPPEVSRCPTSVYTQGGACASSSELFALRGAGPGQATEDGETTVSCRPRDHSVGKILGKSTPTYKSGQMVREGCEDPEGRSLKEEEVASITFIRHLPIGRPLDRKGTGAQRNK